MLITSTMIHHWQLDLKIFLLSLSAFKNLFQYHFSCQKRKCRRAVLACSAVFSCQLTTPDREPSLWQSLGSVRFKTGSVQGEFLRGSSTVGGSLFRVGQGHECTVVKELHTPSAPSYTLHRFPEKQPGVFLGMCEQPSTLSASLVCLISLALSLTPTCLAQLTEALSKHKHLSLEWQRGNQFISLTSSLFSLFPVLSNVSLGATAFFKLSLPRFHPPTYPLYLFQSFCLLCLLLSRLFSCLLWLTFDPTSWTYVSGRRLSEMAFFCVYSPFSSSDFGLPLQLIGPFKLKTPWSLQIMSRDD